jgi:hypothetical protein
MTTSPMKIREQAKTVVGPLKIKIRKEKKPNTNILNPGASSV